MKHVMRAEYEVAGVAEEPGEIKRWHMVRGEGAVAMCGRALEGEAEARPGADWGQTAEPFCHTCGAIYLREVP